MRTIHTGACLVGGERAQERAQSFHGGTVGEGAPVLRGSTVKTEHATVNSKRSEEGGSCFVLPQVPRAFRRLFLATPLANMQHNSVNMESTTNFS